MTRDSGRETRCARDGSDYLGRKNGGRDASMIVGRLIGWVAFLAGAAVLVRDVLVWIDTKHWAPIALGQLWYQLNRSSLNLAQAVIQRYIHPFLWDPIIVTILLSWAFAVLMILGVLLLAVFRKRARRYS
jgi:ABC-type Fe3+ transport system permease subunit